MGKLTPGADPAMFPIGRTSFQTLDSRLRDREGRQVLEQFEQALSEAHEQMQRYYDDRSDDWIESEKADEFTEKMEAVEELIDQIADCRGRIE